MMPSFTQIITTLFGVYISYSLWTMYGVYYPKNCPPGDACIEPYISNKPKVQILVYTSEYKSLSKSTDLKLIWKEKDLDYGVQSEKNLNLSLSYQTRKNGTLYCHIFTTWYMSAAPSANIRVLLNNQYTLYTVSPLTKYLHPEAETFSLLNDGSAEKKSVKYHEKPVTHWRSKMDIHLMVEDYKFFQKALPAELMNFLKIDSAGQYVPFLYVDELTDKIKNYKVLNESDEEASVSIQYSPISLGKLRLWTQVGQSMALLKDLGFKEKDVDDVKGIFADTNFYLLLLTFFVATLHLLFDFLAFKNDISFWRGKKRMVGLSLRVIVWRCISQIIIFIYLMDENTSLLVLIPAGIGSLIELWKVSKAAKLELTWNGMIPSFKFGSTTEDEKLTEKFDSESMKYLSYLLYPLCIGGAVYSLLYVPHKSWYSWCIHSLVNGVYAFGFLFMLPQLFVNYKMKSVAHLPWRAFMYKAFNTFIDDLFAFIITMPTAHRLACFRDDIVFLAYLYQRWLYPVDKKRVNEYGQSYGEEKKKDQ